QPVRISTELVQIDVVVTDKQGRVVKGLTKDDFELYENGKKQLVSFFEFVDASQPRAIKEAARNDAPKPGELAPPPGLGERDVRRIFAFVVDDLTTRYEDLTYLRQMLTNFVETQMQPTDLVAIVRTVGGKGLLQQFTTDKDLLRRAIAGLTAATHPLSAFHNPETPKLPTQPSGTDVNVQTGDQGEDIPDTDNPLDDTNRMLRSYMSLATAGFVIDSMKQLPGRKSLVLISGGLPIFSTNPGTEAGAVANFLNVLTDKATRAGVAINTMDIRGLQAYSGVAGFEETEARSAMGTGTAISDPIAASGNPNRSGFGRIPDEKQFGYRNPFDQLDAHMGLRVLASTTGGLAVLGKNDFDDGLRKIIQTSEGYYLLAYTPTAGKFNGEFRKIEVKAKGDGLKVYSRRGYLARSDAPAVEPATKQEQLLQAIKSPLMRRDVSVDAMVLYKPAPQNQGAIDIHVTIDPKQVRFEQAGDKQQADLDVAGFVFDQFGKLRGGFSETLRPAVTPAEYSQISKMGLPYAAQAVLPPGAYQIRIAVRDNKTESIGTLSRYLEVPDLAKGRLTATSLLLAAVPAGETKVEAPTPITASRQMSRKQDLRYAVIIYNAKLKDGKPQVQTQMTISQNGQVLFKQPEESVTPAGKDAALVKWGQLGLSGVKPGRYTITIVVTDQLADKKAQTITRSMDFVVVN
ncbi:MAG TPA: VWA domain-containing protein, partial [Blastocatellia bacterium]|nr:VWA domain-containing protein [Blastocatellia bacterium]